MHKVLSAVFLYALSCPALLAAMKEMDAANAPAETVDMVYVVIFGIIFIGAVIGFFVYLFWNDRKPKSEK